MIRRNMARKEPTSSGKHLYQAIGVAALLTVALIPLQLWLCSLLPLPLDDTTRAWFGMVQTYFLLGLFMLEAAGSALRQSQRRKVALQAAQVPSSRKQ
jgi:hypothetical protein